MNKPDIESMRSSVIRESSRRTRLRRMMAVSEGKIRAARMLLAVAIYGAPGEQVRFRRGGQICTGTVLGFEDDYIDTNKICIVRVSDGACGEYDTHISDPDLVVRHE